MKVQFETLLDPYSINLIIPHLVSIVSKHRNVTAPYYSFVYTLTFNVINQSPGTSIIYFIFQINTR
jgi:hypothetical protein